MAECRPPGQRLQTAPYPNCKDSAFVQKQQEKTVKNACPQQSIMTARNAVFNSEMLAVGRILTANCRRADKKQSIRSLTEQMRKMVFRIPKDRLLHAKRPSFRNLKATCFQLPDCQAFENRPYRPPLQLAILHAKRRRKRTMQMQEMLPGCASEMKIKPRFTRFFLHFARLALSLDKIGCASEMKIKPRFTRFFFAFRSACTIFAGKNNRNA